MPKSAIDLIAAINGWAISFVVDYSKTNLKAGNPFKLLSRHSIVLEYRLNGGVIIDPWALDHVTRELSVGQMVRFLVVKSVHPGSSPQLATSAHILLNLF